MTETREASWYEIALTHKQIVKIFVALLLCLVAAFFSGVWIGRDGSLSTVEASPQIAASDLATAVEKGEVGQLNFFTPDGKKIDKEKPAEPEPAIPAVGGETTLVDDLNGARAEDEQGAEPGAKNAPPEALIARAGEAGARRQGPDAAVEVTRETAVAPSKPTPQPGAHDAGDLVVQVFSSNDAAQARKVLGRLASSGHPAFLSPVEVEGRTMYRVRIGPYAERVEAERVADTVKRTFKLETWITSKST